MPDPNGGANPWRYFGLGLELAGATAILMWLGYLFDQWRGTEPWGLIVGALLGIIGGLYNLIREAWRANQ